MPLFRKKKKMHYSGEWVQIPGAEGDLTKIDAEGGSPDNRTGGDRQLKKKSRNIWNRH